LGVFFVFSREFRYLLQRVVLANCFPGAHFSLCEKPRTTLRHEDNKFFSSRRPRRRLIMQMVGEYCSYMFARAITKLPVEIRQTGPTNIKCETIQTI
jgi:hypothetical protein